MVFSPRGNNDKTLYGILASMAVLCTFIAQSDD